MVEAFERGNFDAAFTNRLDQMLAWFAQPGKFMCPKGTDPRRCAAAFADAMSSSHPNADPYFYKRDRPPCKSMRGKDAMSSSHQNTEGVSAADATGTSRPRVRQIAPTDPREIRELKQIVNGLHEEMAAYLANGNGTPRSYWRRLIERTVQESQIYERTRRELEKETSPQVWEQKNESLRRLGLRTIPNPKDAE